MIKKIINKFWGTPDKRAMIKKINQLPIASSGIDKENDPFVRLEDGTILYGKTSNNYNVIFKYLQPKIKEKLNIQCIQVAADIVIRYVEGGLKYGGPKKQSRYVVQPGDSVSEMGGYQGFCSVKLAQQVGTKGQVIAIEPMEDNFRLLSKNKEKNNLTQLKVINRAVWDEAKDVSFERKKGDGQSSSIEMSYDNPDNYIVKAETLDIIYEKFQMKPLDFMIIQLNGAEINALRGLTSFKPKQLSIAARYDTENQDAAQQIKNHLEKKGYIVEIDEDDFVFAHLS